MANRRSYYRIDYLAKSALSIGAADGVETDHDVVLDSRGLPIIPATSLAGVYRSYFGSGIAEQYFGASMDDDSTIRGSLIRVYDATWVGGNSCVTVRNSVSLENKVAKPGLKFDRQIVEQGARFQTYIEVCDSDICHIEDIVRMLAEIESGSLLIGSKTTRGFGRLGIESCLLCEFDLDDSEGRESWLDFAMFEDASWNGRTTDDLTEAIKEASAAIASGQMEISLELQQTGALSVREYSTEPDYPDFGQLYVRGLKDGNKDAPIIPGTSWAGAIRERYELFGGAELTRGLFGFVGKENDEHGPKSVARKSRITFSESVLTGGTWKVITRNSIDRFTGGTKDGALFTMRTYYSGKTHLDIRINRSDAGFLNEEIAPLLAVLADLHNGFLSVGGLGAVGHGAFRIKRARLEIGGAELVGFSDDLLKTVEGEYIQPDVAGLADRIAQLATSLDIKGGSRG